MSIHIRLLRITVHLEVFVVLICMIIVSPGCAHHRVDLVKSITAKLEVVPTVRTHRIEHVFAFQEGPDLIVYGKLKKVGGFCLTPGWIDMAVVSEGKVLYKAGLPYIKRGKRRPGWYGANFRVRVPMRVPKGAAIRLALHGDSCHLGETFDVADNRAVPSNSSAP